MNENSFFTMCFFWELMIGERRLAFAEIVDAAEKRNNLIIVSSNLYAADIGEMYGDRVLDRVKAITNRVLFEGESLRR